MDSNTLNPTDKTKLANSILKEMLGIKNTESLWTRECIAPSENKTSVKYSKKSEECPEAELYFQITVAEDFVGPHWTSPGEMKLCAGISKDCVNSFIGEKMRQYFGKKSPNQELDDVMSQSKTQKILSEYQFNPSPPDYIKKLGGKDRFIYHAVLTNDKAQNYLKNQ
ncbi:MAG: hypothetical protein KAJ91_03830 [Candidatus Aenigmarchaeota archaeon]|nr:hypothetical protein [Candidatus Aenigmarchaeota archaeon]